MDSPVAVVTGAGRGIGLSTAQRFLAEGYRVAILEVSARALEEARPELPPSDDLVRLFPCSVSDRPAIRDAIGAIETSWGRVDALVNNAGINRAGGLQDQADSDWDAVLAVNLTGAFVVTGEVVRLMLQGRSGAIVNVGSIGAHAGGASPAYAASKAGLEGLTRQMARELGPHGITANLVAPGVTTTGWVERNLGPERMTAVAEAAPLRRLATPEDIAGVIAFLASPAARHITGQVISVSGGAWMP